MKTEINDQFDQLINNVNRESAPHVDVRQAVLKTVQEKPAARLREPFDITMTACAVVSVAAACIVLVMGADSLLLLEHPAMEIVQSTENLFQ